MSELEFVKNALSEDLGRGDLFERILCENLSQNLNGNLDSLANKNLAQKCVSANVIAKDCGVLSGVKYAKILLSLLNLESIFHKNDGENFVRGEILANVSGNYVAILQAERTLLNLLQHSSGIASNVAQYVKILRENGFKTKILDTRKTRPNMRDFEKYSVRNGGGSNHRFGLDDCLMLKDTHLAHISDLAAFVKMARNSLPWTCKIEVECESESAAIRAMESGCDIIMCDNMEIKEIVRVVECRNKDFCHILIESSGNVNTENLLSHAQSGVDAISSGALIHHATWIDLSLKMA